MLCLQIWLIYTARDRDEDRDCGREQWVSMYTLCRSTVHTTQGQARGIIRVFLILYLKLE